MLRTLLASQAIVAETAALGGFVVLTSPLTRRFHEPAIRLWARGIVAASGIDLHVEGVENIDPRARYVFVANHQSLLDIPCISLAVPNPVRYITKRSLFRIPVFGTAMRAVGMVEIDRSRPDDAMRRIQEAERGVGQRCSLLFFAEGTRSPDGRLRRFKRGAFVTALSLQLPVVPIAVQGTRDLLPKGTLQLRPGPVRVSIGSPIAVGEDSPEERERLRAAALARVATMLGQSIPAEPASPSPLSTDAPSRP